MIWWPVLSLHNDETNLCLTDIAKQTDAIQKNNQFLVRTGCFFTVKL